MSRTPSSAPPERSDSPAAASTITRCDWANGTPAMIAYHDQEWGVPLHDDVRLFEMLTLEGAQAGLSWRTILDRRDEYRRAFHDFDINRVAAMSDRELETVLRESGVIRNRLKVFSVRTNAQAALRTIEAHGSLDAWLWSFVNNTPIVTRRRRAAEIPARTDLSDHMSKSLRKAGFNFIGSTICYAFMQATGIVDDHLATCFRAQQPGSI